MRKTLAEVGHHPVNEELYVVQLLEPREGGDDEVEAHLDQLHKLLPDGQRVAGTAPNARRQTIAAG